MLAPESSTTTEHQLASWAQAVKRSALQEMLSETSRPGIISFALGLPSAELFPIEAYGGAVERVLSSDPRALQYGPPFGPLKGQIVELMARRGVSCKEEEIFLTAGAQQGMNLLARLLVDSGRQVLTEEFIYTGFQQVLDPLRPRILTVSTDLESGMDVEAVETLLIKGARPAFIYSITDGHNPLAVCMSYEKRMRLVELAHSYHVPIVEDDAYGFIHYANESLPPLRALDDQWVFYVGSFSKILSPGLRVGWLVVPEHLISTLSILKESTDIDTSTFTQRMISAYIDTGQLGGHVERITRAYQVQRDAMIEALREYFPHGSSWRTPSGGVFIWVQMCNSIDTGYWLQKAISQEKAAYIPGTAFSVSGGGDGANYLRLNFSHSGVELIREGIARLGRLFNAVSTTAVVF